MDLEAELIGNCSVEEIKRGFTEDDKQYTCLVCGEHFEKGEIFTFSGHQYEDYKAVRLHIQQEHGSMQECLLKTQPYYLGISGLQLQLLNFFASGMSDKAIAEKLEVSASTIRNHRYKLRERERQNKLFLALMESFNETDLKSNLEGEGQVNEEEISDRERKRVLERYITETGRLKTYPSLERNKNIILEEITKHFLPDRKYTEDEVKAVLQAVTEDYKFLKDEMIAYHYLEKAYRGAVYWVRNTKSLVV